MINGKTVNKIISHAKFNTETYVNDIALLKLDAPLEFSSEYLQARGTFHHLNDHFFIGQEM